MSTSEDYRTGDSVEDCIRAVKADDERELTERLWELRADEIRKRDLFSNLEAIRNATKAKFDRLRQGLPDRCLEFTDNPARYFVMHNGGIPSVTVNVGMSVDGALLTIDTTRTSSPNDIPSKTADTVRVEATGSSTYYLYHDRSVTASEIADIALSPILHSLRRRRVQ
jgi:hypothetical protein